jgi:hypothetical protein
MATTPAPVATKTSWLSKVGAFIGKVFNIAKQVEPTAAAVASVLVPQFAPEITLANDLFSKIASEAVAVEGTFAAAGNATGSGPQKLEAVLANIGPDIDAWVAANFPGSKQLSAVAKTGLINSVVAVLNELEPPVGATVA